MKPTFGNYNKDHKSDLFCHIINFFSDHHYGNSDNFFRHWSTVGFLFGRFKQSGYQISNIMAMYLITVGVQSLHYLEEYLSDFQTEFPQLFGYTWSAHQFVGRNYKDQTKK